MESCSAEVVEKFEMVRWTWVEFGNEKSLFKREADALFFLLSSHSITLIHRRLISIMWHLHGCPRTIKMKRPIFHHQTCPKSPPAPLHRHHLCSYCAWLRLPLPTFSSFLWFSFSCLGDQTGGRLSLQCSMLRTRLLTSFHLQLVGKAKNKIFKLNEIKIYWNHCDYENISISY